MTLLETLIAVAISATFVIALGTVVSKSTQIGNRTTLNASLAAVKSQIFEMLKRYPSFSKTTQLNSTFSCALSNSACPGGPFVNAFKIYDDNGDEFYDPTSTANGFTFSGVPCTVTSGTAPDKDCPIRVNLTWTATCTTCNPAQINITATFRVFNFITQTAETVNASSFTLNKTFDNTYCTLPWGQLLADGGSVTAYYSASGNTTGSCATSESRTCDNGVLTGSYQNRTCACDLPWGGTIEPGASVTAYLAPTSGSCTSESRVCNSSNTGVLTGTYQYSGCTALTSCTLPWGGSIASGTSVTAYSSTNAASCTAISQSRTCTAGTLSGTYTNQSCVNCAGTVYGGYCWYVGGNAKTCDNVCSAHGGCVLAGILAYGSGGTDAACKNLLDAVGVLSGSVTATSGKATGCSINIYSGGGNRVRQSSPATTCAAKYSSGYRVCSCTN